MFHTRPICLKIWSGPERLDAGCPWARRPGLSPSFLRARPIWRPSSDTDRWLGWPVAFPTDQVFNGRPEDINNHTLSDKHGVVDIRHSGRSNYCSRCPEERSNNL
ncbi:hypothetical protein FVEG_16223 [Fusarium verticillioides 7600]|uniref:Uncharacterized protein n=1 Tax=Gibberella moniliformis (strain M3125 / FGSC 7600) TaxID=334819 RepID=W7MUC3_GIBM7|nr:hypothetical protein FVEG_16223 [Fusarium verticillioides 7600]XP_018754159.1 hypothetical protein FVEG_16223 [Fusarium verticillioides 7600]XP_018754160.1 hypothetical protein FVEG_16223 [Fusarium verticillioides 7600]EWG47967.1 hypothetical protein FVEG_16223 [Fusarium verticillioides 7600]EWG47968.1 hypothetical protein FVEG_16223 [Fusarium verticillioides 7600]EWG47969.1 hypothetical protein FVEG_16223 [Fusarium verticillioides 7600]